MNIIDWFGGALTGIVLSWFVVIIKKVSDFSYRQKLIKSITGFSIGNLPLAIIGAPLRSRPSSTNLTESPDGIPLIGYGPIISYTIIAANLLVLRSKKMSFALPNIILANQYEQLPDYQKTQHDILLLGYPASNEASKILEPLMKLPVQFFIDEKHREIHLNETNKLVGHATYTKDENGNIRTTSDCGLLVRVNHPLNKNKKILYLAGCETFGLKIASEALLPDNIPNIIGLSRMISATWHYKWLPTLGLSTVENTEFVAIFSADVISLTTGTPVLQFAWVRQANFNEDSWKQTYPKI